MKRRIAASRSAMAIWLGGVLSVHLSASCFAVEGPVAAGPIGGTDIRSAILPPPGVYGGVIGERSQVGEIHDGTGNQPAALDAVDLKAKVGGPFFLYVPEAKFLEGSIGFFGVFPAGQECGRLVSSLPSRCISGFGDPYVELAWSRGFGQIRTSRDPGAFPIFEGLVLGAGIGAVLPIGQYDVQLLRSNGISLGNQTFDLAPSLAVTYTTPAMIVEGTEFSAKIYWNNYWTNTITHYRAGSLLDIDFAVTEHIGRFQLGPTGVYLHQLADDRQDGQTVLPDGRRLEYLALGGVANCDIAELGALVRIKALTTVVARNSGVSKVIAVGFAKKLQ